MFPPSVQARRFRQPGPRVFILLFGEFPDKLHLMNSLKVNFQMALKKVRRQGAQILRNEAYL